MVGNPDHGGADSGEIVFLCIANAQRELPHLPLRAWCGAAITTAIGRGLVPLVSHQVIDEQWPGLDAASRS
jgi:hypothetical protein